MARYDTLNAAALKRLVGAGTQLRPFNVQVLDACFEAANKTFDEKAAESADFKKAYEAMKVIRGDDYLWFQLSENTFDTYMMIQQQKKKI
jgi:TRAP-type mannitol/chloroaromatic compound transport system substrate-binding protein